MSLAPPLPITVDVLSPTRAPAASLLPHPPAHRRARHRDRRPRTARRPGLCLELHVIGSSHQVVLAGPEDHLAGSEDHLIETFACPPTADGPAPQVADDGTPHWGTRQVTRGAWAGFTCHGFRATRTTAADEFRTAVAEALDRVRDHDRHLVVGFPGDPDAITALALSGAEAGHLSWQTWHVYPQQTEIVHTTTELTNAPDVPSASARGVR
ncbi:DUF2617 family protein [Brevibacterium casei]|nr:DUF2617 family protein [Brevibacterium casei]